MELSKKEFEILVYIERRNGEKISQRKLAAGTGFSLGAVNKLLPILLERGLIDIPESKNVYITKEGLAALEPYRVKRAIFMAAGFGSRLVPITLNTPKALIRIHGKPMIETMSQQFVNKYLPSAPDIMRDYKVWIARYGEYRPDVRLAIWQLCPDGRVSGIVGEVDINVFNGYHDDFKKFLKTETVK